VLKAAGVKGGIQGFNQKVQQIADAHQRSYGQLPSAGLTLDVARSDVQPQHFDALFSVPKSPIAARGQGVLAQHQRANPYDYLIPRADGSFEPDGPLRTLAVTSPVQPDTKQIAKTHPWVPYASMSMPIPGSDQLNKSLAALEGKAVSEQSGQTTIGGKTLSQYTQARGQARGVPTMGATLGLDAAPATGPYKSQAAAVGDFSAVGGAVQTVKQAQQHLIDNFPTYFAGLKPVGTWNNDWVSAQTKFVGSATYADAWTKKLAQDNYFGKNTAEFASAWKAKQQKLKSGDPNAYQVYLHTPLAYFGDAESIKRFLTSDAGNDHWYSFAVHYTIGAAEGLGKTAYYGGSGLASEGKSQAASATKFLYEIGKNLSNGKGAGAQEAADISMKTLKQNPTWLRIAYPPLPAHPTGGLAAADFASNFLLDLYAGNKLVIGGREIVPGETKAFNSARYTNTTIEWGFNSMKKRGLGGVGEASKMLQGGEQLNVAVAKRIQAGDITLGEYKSMVSDLFHKGKVEVRGAPTVLPEGVAGKTKVIHTADNPNNAVFRSLWSAKNPDPRLWTQTISKHLDHLDATLRSAPQAGTSNTADALSSLRGLFAHVAPRGGEALRIEDPKTPERLYNWAIQQFNDRSYAQKIRNDFVVARARNDFGSLEDLNKDLSTRYAAEYPNRAGVRTPLDPSEGPLTESQSFSYLKTPANRTKDVNNFFDATVAKAQKYNDNLLTIGRYHRQMIIGGGEGPIPFPGGESLFWKHAVADTLRRFAGGAGLRFGLNAAQKKAKAEVEQHLFENPAVGRDLSVKRAQSKMGEQRWLTHDGPISKGDNFITGEHLADTAKMNAAGAYLRQLVTDDALTAYRASSEADKTALFRHVWHSPFYQNKIAKDELYLQDLRSLQEVAPKGLNLKGAISDLKKGYAQQYADELWKTYKEIDVNGALDRAHLTFITNTGAGADKALAKFIQDEKLSFAVRDPLIQGTNKFDNWSTWWIGKLMTFNKANRQSFFDHVLYDSYSHLTSMGWARSDAIATASDLAKFQTVYHMLDFSNMLQVEQNLRWFSYYATKHRLYWSWLARQFATRPLLAAAADDVSKTVDKNGNITFRAFGVNVTIPAARLVWANTQQYPEVSSILTFGSDYFTKLPGQGIVGAGQQALADQTATGGTVLGRQDQWVMMAARLASSPKTYDAATAGMSPVQKSSFDRIMHGYILSYRSAHDGMYPSEADAVHAGLLNGIGSEMYRANLFFPFYVDKPPVGEPSQPTWYEARSKQFDALKSPKQKRAFLDKNPDFADLMGASQDQGVWLHEAPMWDAFRTARTSYLDEMELLYQKSRATGWNLTLQKEYKKTTSQYSQAIDKIKLRDSATWMGNATYPKGSVISGTIVQPGPWTKKLETDPLASKTWLHEMFPGIAQKQLDGHTISENVVQLRAEADKIRQAQAGGTKKLTDMGYTAQTARDRLTNIFNKIAVFNGAPKNATTKLVSDYYGKFVSPYIKQRDGVWTKRVNAAKGTPDENAVFAAFRAWKETHDHAVTVDGVKFPSPVSWGTMQLPPDQYKNQLATAASSDPLHVTGYEWKLLGVNAPPSVNSVISTLETLEAQYKADPAYAGTSLAKEQKLRAARVITKGYPSSLPGFPNGIAPHPGFYAWYVGFASLPKVDRYERTSLYINMAPRAKTQFDSLIGSVAKEGTKLAANKNSGYPSNYIKSKWKSYIKTVVMPDLQKPQYKALATELREYPADFLYTLAG
jgi:hypothetical protein